MTALFKKLNLKDQAEIVVLNAPPSFEPELAALAGLRIRRRLAEVKVAHFCLAFVTKQKEVDSLAERVTAKAEGDAILWFAYPKGTSKNYTCDFNRDTGWAVLAKNGFRGVRQVAIDDDWSALRFRRTQFVKSESR